jgi:predicted DCC family thiol-disulfide oxidoreductase YuxK
VCHRLISVLTETTEVDEKGGIVQKTLLTLYIDGNCPLCVAEVKRLRAWDRHSRLAFVDIAEPEFDPVPLGVDLAALNRQIHAWTVDGHCLTGIDTFVAAYTHVGKGWIVAPLRIPMLRPFFRAAYLAFARNRMRLSRWALIDTRTECTSQACGFRLD